jgi:GT2 family glycosyltransferase
VSSSVVITNYNTWPITLRCLRALERHAGGRADEVLVVDDASRDPAPRDLPGPVRVIANPHNLGYAASVNVGLREAKGDWVLLLDSDAYPAMDVIEPLSRAFAAEPKLGAVGLQTVNEHGQPTECSMDVPDAMGFLLGPRLEGTYVKLRSLFVTPPRVLYSCALAVRRSAFLEIGGFDEGFDFLDADLDFSLRLSLAGWECRSDRTIVAVHEGGGSPQTVTKRVLRCYRNRWRFLEKHGRLGSPWALKTLLLARHLCEVQVLLAVIGTLGADDRAIYLEKLKTRGTLLRTLWSGYRDAIA